MLALRPNCEACDRDLPPDSPDAMICTFECTFCSDCAEEIFAGTCPNCGGNFEKRPIRPAGSLGKYPAATERVHRDDSR
jgi:hypothetical protein